jgi:hypothetical protein
MGKNGKKIVAAATENIFPKLELNPILMYFMVL